MGVPTAISLVSAASEKQATAAQSRRALASGVHHRAKPQSVAAAAAISAWASVLCVNHTG